MYENMPRRSIMCIDMCCFYASCIASLEHLDVMKTPIAVVGNFNQKGSIVLAASPMMKTCFQVKTGTRLYEIPKHPDIRLFEPKMEFFIRISMEITRLLNSYVPKEAIHVYSVDESFIDLTGTEKLWGLPEETAKRIQREIYSQFEIPSTVGMGPNMLLSKLALDLEGKKTGFAKWTYEDVQGKLWPVAPLSKMWGIGRRTESSLNHMGIFSVGDLAKADLKTLEERFGIMGNQLYYHARGIDLSELGAPIIEGQISYGKGQILMRDYNKKEEVLAVILEMCEDIARRAREAFKIGRTISLGLSYSKNAFGGGFHRSRTIDEPTNDTMKIYKVCQQLLDEYYIEERPVRQLTISITKLESEHSMQLSLFDTDRFHRRKLGATMDQLRTRYGSTAVLRAVSYTEAGTAVVRAKLLGGHKK
ncbi:UV damage repair protein UvrX [Viridibacillus sp. YIM B01967]|uniref:UV damage repair protein UvrX n=1 Tax=Viridibacillus soli TaxID=2798301 RepID=A0ABS1H7S4_9BACL|nr:UV damage repair protein UvrX [Viridibacillus soli]MBK3495463.1 UV damage repair protein UvrX [Viridibacillus soli]